MSSKTRIKDTITKGEKSLINLTTGKKQPYLKRKKGWRKEIANIKKKCGEVYIPHD